MNYVPTNLIKFPNNVVNFALSNPDLSLFRRGMELLRWINIVDVVANDGLCF